MKTRIELRVVIFVDQREVADTMESEVRQNIKEVSKDIYIETLVNQDE